MDIKNYIENNENKVQDFLNSYFSNPFFHAERVEIVNIIYFPDLSRAELHLDLLREGKYTMGRYVMSDETVNKIENICQ